MNTELETQLTDLNRMYKEQGEIYHKYALNIDLSDTSLWILYGLCIFKDQCTQNDLCNAFCYSKQTVNSAVSSLIKKQYLTLLPVKNTKNCKSLELTPEGRKFCDQKIVPLIKADEQSFSQLTKSERELYLTFMQKQISSLQHSVEKLSSSFGGELNAD